MSEQLDRIFSDPITTFLFLISTMVIVAYVCHIVHHIQHQRSIRKRFNPQEYINVHDANNLKEKYQRITHGTSVVEIFERSYKENQEKME